MKIGILSMQRICNYGSFMQSYALKNIIEDLGHEVEFVDYKIEKPILKLKKDKSMYIKDRIRSCLIDIIVSNSILIRLLPESKRSIFNNIKRYNEEFLPMIGVTKRKNYRSNVDVLVIGSDEVFNCLQKGARIGYSKELFGYNRNSKKLISYAASFGNTTLERLKINRIDDEISSMLSEFDCISVRDNNSGTIVKSLIGKEPNYNLDPVLIYDFLKEIPNIDVKGNYIVVYAYRNRLKKEEIQAIKEFAEKKNKRLLCLGGYHEFCDEYIDASPFELLAYVKSADYVITDTFHGTIFSIINHKQFVSFIRKSENEVYGNQEKMTDLLQRLGLADREISESWKLEQVIEKSIDYDSVEKIRNYEIEKTRNYLKNNLK
ncbi:polysaccharide pyruvyl transferase family protein [Clostridium cadaveris]|uniref:polysaccharide pyruvyl transferase family protein n=1 Tax=Clostridium cadaveris TaxID=1529 RepID=UPI0015B43DB9|nr:polysaccharide pyruvyl transferase family protein [Clostridium cadaveris]NWK12047.1 polysaccharide pyruvyl transferase family protein [Clostridium cadaveris]